MGKLFDHWGFRLWMLNDLIARRSCCSCVQQCCFDLLWVRHLGDGLCWQGLLRVDFDRERVFWTKGSHPCFSHRSASVCSKAYCYRNYMFYDIKRGVHVPQGFTDHGCHKQHPFARRVLLASANFYLHWLHRTIFHIYALVVSLIFCIDQSTYPNPIWRDDISTYKLWTAGYTISRASQCHAGTSTHISDTDAFS